MKRLTTMTLIVAALVALACEGSGKNTLDLKVTGSTQDRVAIVRKVDGDNTEDTIKVPYSRSYDADLLIVQVTAKSGSVDCSITFDGTVVARDEDRRREVATCSAERAS